MANVRPVLSPTQLETLAEHGEERTAEVGEMLFSVGDESYPFIAIREGEAEIRDAAGNEIVSHGPNGFLSEISLLTGQTVFLDAVVTKPMRYVAVDRDVLRTLLFDDGSLADVLLSAFIRRRELLQTMDGGRGDHRPALVRGDPAGGRVRAANATPAHLARPLAFRGPGGRGARIPPGRRRAPAGTASGRQGAAQPEQRRGRPHPRDRPRARPPRGGGPGGDRRRPGRAGLGGLRDVGGTGHPRGREDRARRAGRGPRGGSRTTSGSRRGSAAAS